MGMSTLGDRQLFKELEEAMAEVKSRFGAASLLIALADNLAELGLDDAAGMVRDSAADWD